MAKQFYYLRRTVEMALEGYSTSGITDPQLQDLGDLGWELCGIGEHVEKRAINGAPYKVQIRTYYFKRDKAYGQENPSAG